jgi:hypothetical protein
MNSCTEPDVIGRLVEGGLALFLSTGGVVAALVGWTGRSRHLATVAVFAGTWGISFGMLALGLLMGHPFRARGALATLAFALGTAAIAGGALLHGRLRTTSNLAAARSDQPGPP